MIKRVIKWYSGRKSHVVCVFVDSNDREYSDHCVIGPMSERTANECAHIIQNSTSHTFGERLNGIRFHVDVVPRRILDEEDGAEWLVDTIASSFERHEDVRNLRNSLMNDTALLRNDPDYQQRIAEMFPWMRFGDEDGIVFDSTPWERPNITKRLGDESGNDVESDGDVDD